jgi:hypothetical protein
LGVSADVYSVTSFTELRREGMEVERWNLLHPDEEPRRAWVEETLEDADGPVVAATDYMRAFADQIRPWVHAPYRVLGTDGFGRSDYRKALRDFFEVDRHHVALAALTSLAAEGAVDAAIPGKAIRSYGIDPERPRRGGCEEAPWRRSERSSFPTSAISPTCRSSRCSWRRATAWPRGPARHARVRQGDDGRPGPVRRHGGGDRGQRGRHGLGGLADPHARRSVQRRAAGSSPAPPAAGPDGRAGRVGGRRRPGDRAASPQARRPRRGRRAALRQPAVRRLAASWAST